MLVKKFAIYPESNGEPLMSCKQWRNIITCIFVNATYSTENGFEIVKTADLLGHS